jgi:hypothetical protein
MPSRINAREPGPAFAPRHEGQQSMERPALLLFVRKRQRGSQPPRRPPWTSRECLGRRVAHGRLRPRLRLSARTRRRARWSSGATASRRPSRGSHSARREYGLSDHACASFGSVRRRAVSLPQQPAVPAVFQHHRHPVPVALDVVGANRSLGSLGKQPCDGPSGRNVVAVPLPRVGRRAIDVAMRGSPVAPLLPAATAPLR